MEIPISLARWFQETRTMRFEEAYAGWKVKHTHNSYGGDSAVRASSPSTTPRTTRPVQDMKQAA